MPDASDTRTDLERALDAVAPALRKYTSENLTGELWSRPGLSRRDRSLVTLTCLVARNATGGMVGYFNRALDNGVTPAELSEMLTHLAFYTCWANAFAAVMVLKDIFAKRGIGAEELPEISPEPLAIEDALPDEAIRIAFMVAQITPMSPALQHFTDTLLYHQVWLRPGLAKRDRCLISVVALAAQGQGAFLPFHLGRAVQQGVTREEFDEALAHVAFYAGWGNAMQSTIAAKAFFEGQTAAT